MNALTNTTMTQCGHRYCFTCIKEWVDRKHTCPCCNANLDQKSLFKDHQFDSLIGKAVTFIFLPVDSEVLHWPSSQMILIVFNFIWLFDFEDNWPAEQEVPWSLKKLKWGINSPHFKLFMTTRRSLGKIVSFLIVSEIIYDRGISSFTEGVKILQWF